MADLTHTSEAPKAAPRHTEIRFGTGGWRAEIGKDFHMQNVRLIAQALADRINREGKADKPVIIGYDRRFLSDSAAKWLAEVLAANGITVWFMHRSSPTPLVMHTVMKKGLHYGMEVTASHNPPVYNGVKVVVEEGRDAPVEFTQELEEAITEETGLVTIMYANNEIGTIQPIPEIGAICKKHGVLFHTDAVQAVGNVHIDVKEQNIDMLSLSGHKLHAPKGVGALYIRTGVVLPNFIDGGAQERGKRGGTENVASIVGLATAMEQACSTMDQRVERLTAMRDKLIGEILKIDRSRLNGHPTQRLPGNASFCFQGVEGESLLLMLDLKGISASSGSACTSGSLDPSHVLLAIGLPHEVAHGSLRLSFGDYNTMEDIDYIIETLPPIIEQLRSMSPLWDVIQQGRVNYDQYTEQ